MSGKYYWLKLKKDFFKRHDIRIIEAMPNGKDYVLFYLKLLVEAVDHNGALRFSDTIPYNAEMLSVITNTNIDIVKTALEVFTNLNLIEVLDDSTIYMNEVQKMIGSAANNDNANRQRSFRERNKNKALTDSVTKSNAGVTGNVTNDNENIELELDTDIELDIDRNTNIDINIDKYKDISPVIPAETAKKAEMFEQFWKAYPKKEAKKLCRERFYKIKDLDKIFPTIMQALEIQKKSKQWNEENGAFIPYPQKWISHERWNYVNEIEEKQAAIDDIASEGIDDFFN